MFLFKKKLFLFLLRQSSFIQQNSVCAKTMSGEAEENIKLDNIEFLSYGASNLADNIKGCSQKAK